MRLPGGTFLAQNATESEWKPRETGETKGDGAIKPHVNLPTVSGRPGSAWPAECSAQAIGIWAPQEEADP
jgi:hypothetical protein